MNPCEVHNNHGTGEILQDAAHLSSKADQVGNVHGTNRKLGAALFSVNEVRVGAGTAAPLQQTHYLRHCMERW